MSNDYFEAAIFYVVDGTTAVAAGVNNSLDAIEAGLEKLPSESTLKNGLVRAGIDSGSANAYVITSTNPKTSYTDMQEVVFKASATNTGASTIIVDGIGIIALVRKDGSPLSASDILENEIVSARYNYSSGSFELQGSARASSGGGTMASQNSDNVNITGGTITTTVVDDVSTDIAAMQTVVDPYPLAAESLPTSIVGELQRLRYLIKQITGEAQWYIDPDSSISNLFTIIPATTDMLFKQNTPPTGWTRDTTMQDNSMLCFAATGDIASGGAVNPQSTHLHTGPSHAHASLDHYHTTYGHALTAAENGPHTHAIAEAVGGGFFANQPPTGNNGGISGYYNTESSGSGTPHNHGITTYTNTGSGLTGYSGTGNTASNTAPYYQEIIAATKD